MNQFPQKDTKRRMTSKKEKKRTALSQGDVSDIIAMALSDHASFNHIQHIYGLSQNEVKTLMRTQLKRGSYEAWRRRVRVFSDRRAHYK
jgi:uncharacterized protein (TIGR03643 family)